MRGFCAEPGIYCTECKRPRRRDDAGDIGPVIEDFDAYSEQIFEKSGVPGMAVAVVKDDAVIYLRCFGVKNITTREPVTPHTRFQLASVSKSFTSATIASLVGEGELSWDDEVTSLNPAFQLSDPWVSEQVTIRDLLSHRTGLPEYGGDDLQHLGFNRSEIIHQLRYVPLTGEFRSSYGYSNIGITSAAEAAAAKTGTQWEDLIAERIFIPAGMTNTSARFIDFETAADRVDTYPVTNGTPTPGPFFNDDVNTAAGGVSSTITDMTRYLRLQLGGGSIDGVQVIDARALQETHSPQNIKRFGNDSIDMYALGWEFIAEDGRVRVEHGGDLTSGVSTYVTLWPDENMGIVVLTNGFPGGFILKKGVISAWDDLYFTGAIQTDGYAEAEAAINAAMQPGASQISPFDVLPSAPAGADAAPARPLDAYTGSYTQDYFGTVRVETNDTGDGLLLYAGHLTEPFVLAPYDGDTFVETESRTAVEFIADESGGAIERLHVAMLDEPWMDAVFVRIPS